MEDSYLGLSKKSISKDFDVSLSASQKSFSVSEWLQSPRQYEETYSDIDDVFSLLSEDHSEYLQPVYTGLTDQTSKPENDETLDLCKVALTKEHDYRKRQKNPYQAYRITILSASNSVPRKRPLVSIKKCLENSSTSSKYLNRYKNKIECKQIAAEVIHDFWRRCVFRKVFYYLRDLLTQYADFDPAVALKPINPLESKLLDAASGTYVRFRLGGEGFPPIIVYKIYTCRPIVDVCATSPKNYALEQKRDRKSKIETVSQKSQEISKKKDRLWYSRIENNNWRPCDSLTTITSTTPTKVQTCTYTIPKSQTKKPGFHWQAQGREVLRKTWRKQKRIEWMKRMYDLGRRQISDSPRTEHMLRGAVSDLTKDVEKNGVDCIADEEVDQLLAWITTLDFRSYCDDWNLTGTSRGVESFGDSPLTDVTDWKLFDLDMDVGHIGFSDLQNDDNNKCK